MVRVARTRFRDRQHAGEVLAPAVADALGGAGVGAVVLGLPRGGVPVAAPVAAHLGASLDVLVVRKVGVPGHEELAMGAVAGGGIVVRNDDVVAGLGIDDVAIERLIAAEGEEVAQREARYRGGRPPLAGAVGGRVAVLVDDGLATGATMRAAVLATRAMAPLSIVVAVPVGADATCAALRATADDVVCVHAPPDLQAVGLWYDDFAQTTDDEVRSVLGSAGPAR